MAFVPKILMLFIVINLTKLAFVSLTLIKQLGIVIQSPNS